MEFPFKDIAIYLTFGIDIIAIIVVVWGSIAAIINFLLIEITKKRAKETKHLEKLRAHFGQKLLLGIEFFLVGDLIRAVISPSIDALLGLGLIVLIRTVLSFFLNLEIKDIKQKWGNKVWKESIKQ